MFCLFKQFNKNTVLFRFLVTVVEAEDPAAFNSRYCGQGTLSAFYMETNKCLS